MDVRQTTEIYTHVSNKDIGKIKSLLDMWGGIIPIQDDMRIADIPELSEMLYIMERI